MGFSPFELLYQRQPRGLLDVLREEWKIPSETTDVSASYVDALQKRLKATP